jgi:outer membrane receptor protein involved in Fe transport
LPEFQYDDNVFAAYAIAGFNSAGFVVKAGARAEYAVSGLTSENKITKFIILPQVTVNYKITPKQSIELSYTTSVYRPAIYQLNPNSIYNEPFSFYTGNLDLKQELQRNLKLEYSRNFGDSFASSGLFLKVRNNAVNQYTFINNSGLYQTTPYNLGTIYEYGFQISGSVKLSKQVVVNPFLKVFNIQTEVNNSALQHELANRQEVAVESGLSAIATFKHKIALSFQFQYNSPRIDIQNRQFSDPLWFVSLEKGFGENLKIGVTGALLFAKNFTYTGNEIQSEHFYSFSEGNLQLPALPVWFKIRYQFNKGKKSSQRNRENDDIIEVPKKGF